MNKYLKRAVLALVACVGLMSFSVNEAMAQRGANLAAATDSVEQKLIDGKVWGGSIDTSRPGCAGCPKAAITLVFENFGKLKARIYFAPGDTGYNDHLKGRRSKGDMDVQPAVADVMITPNGGFRIINRYKWEFTPLSDGSYSCQRTSVSEGYADNSFVVRILPPH